MRIALFVDTKERSTTPDIHVENDRIVVRGHLDPKYDLGSNDIAFQDVIVTSSLTLSTARELARLVKQCIDREKVSPAVSRDEQEMGTSRRLVLDDGNTTVTIDERNRKFPHLAHMLITRLETIATDLLEEQWHIELIDRCRTLAEQIYGDNIHKWYTVTRTSEKFNVQLNNPKPQSEPSSDASNVTIHGERVVLRCDDRYIAFHAGDHRIVLVEEWKRGDLPSFPPAILDVANARIKLGRIDGAITALERAQQSHGGPLVQRQAAIQLAEILAEQGKYGEARTTIQRARDLLIPGEHQIYYATLAWITSVEQHPQTHAPAPSQIAPPAWWRKAPHDPLQRPWADQKGKQNPGLE